MRATSALYPTGRRDESRIVKLLLQRIPPETKVAAVVLGAALLQVGLVAWLGLRTTDQQRAESERALRDRAQRAQTVVLEAGRSRLLDLERAALREIERTGRPLDVRIRDALGRGAPYEAAFLVTRGPDGLPRLHHPSRPPLDGVPRTPRDAAARRQLEELAHAETADPATALRTAEELADTTGDTVAAALALQMAWRAALRLEQEDRALALAMRLLERYPTVSDDRTFTGEGAPFSLGAAVVIAELRRRAVERAGFDHAPAFAAAVRDRRVRAQRMRDLLSAATYRVEVEDCARTVEDARLHIPGARTSELRAFLAGCDRIDVDLDRARAAAAGVLASALAVPGATRVSGEHAVLALQPLHDDVAAAIDAVVLLAPMDAIWNEALTPLRHGPDLPEGVALVPQDGQGRPVGDAPAGPLLASAVPFGPQAPGLRLTAVLADPAVLDRETAEARRLWVWILAASVLAVLAAALLAVRSVLREVRLARLKGDFVSNLSHELRTPLTSLRMFVETLQEGRVRDEEERQQCLSFIAQETDRLATLVDRVLQFAAFSRGRAPIELRSADPAVVLRRALEIFRSRALRANARVETVLEQDLPEALLDRDALIQVILNLLDNAVKYGSQDGARIRVTLRGDGARVRIDVEDDGPGVPEREKQLVFEEFYRGDESLSSRVQGAGIGLALCRRIILGHGGRIEVSRSRTLGGACFSVWLPEAAVGRRIAVATQEGRG